MASPGALTTAGEDLLRRIGFDEVAAHVGGINQAISDGHKTLRAIERAQALKLEGASGTHDDVLRDMERARRHAREARAALKRHGNGETWKTLKRQYAGKKGEIEPSLAEARAYWVRAIDASDFGAADAAEIAEVWDQGADALRKRGVAGVFKYLDDALAEVESKLTGDRDFGREPQSPLEWWQWLIIIAIVGIAVGALIACLIWAGCAWIKQIFIATCWGTGAVGGWAGICVAFGF